MKANQAGEGVTNMINLNATSNQRRSPNFLDGPGETMKGSGDVLNWGISAPSVVHGTKLGILSDMYARREPVTAGELFWRLGGATPLLVLDYHLCTLVQAGAVEVVVGQELHFRLSGVVSRKLRQSEETFKKQCR